MLCSGSTAVGSPVGVFGPPWDNKILHNAIVAPPASAGREQSVNSDTVLSVKYEDHFLLVRPDDYMRRVILTGRFSLGKPVRSILGSSTEEPFHPGRGDPVANLRYLACYGEQSLRNELVRYRHHSGKQRLEPYYHEYFACESGKEPSWEYQVSQSLFYVLQTGPPGNSALPGDSYQAREEAIKMKGKAFLTIPAPCRYCGYLFDYIDGPCVCRLCYLIWSQPICISCNLFCFCCKCKFEDSLKKVHHHWLLCGEFAGAVQTYDQRFLQHYGLWSVLKCIERSRLPSCSGRGNRMVLVRTLTLVTITSRITYSWKSAYVWDVVMPPWAVGNCPRSLEILDVGCKRFTCIVRNSPLEMS